MTNEQTLIQTLRAEWTLQTRHCNILEAQSRALLSCDRERFRVLQSECTALQGQLKAQEETRQAVMTDVDGKPCVLSALLETVSARGRRTLESLRDNLRRVLNRIQELSRKNTLLIENELKYIAFMLDLYVETGRAAETRYGGIRRGGRRLMLDRCV